MKDDILLNDDNNIVIVDGDMVVGDVTRQVMGNVLLACLGEYKEYPMVGIGLVNYLNGSEAPFLIGRIKTQLEAMDIKTKKITVKDGIINVEV